MTDLQNTCSLEEPKNPPPLRASSEPPLRIVPKPASQHSEETNTLTDLLQQFSQEARAESATVVDTSALPITPNKRAKRSRTQTAKVQNAGRARAAKPARTGARTTGRKNGRGVAVGIVALMVAAGVIVAPRVSGDSDPKKSAPSSAKPLAGFISAATDVRELGEDVGAATKQSADQKAAAAKAQAKKVAAARRARVAMAKRAAKAQKTTSSSTSGSATSATSTSESASPQAPRSTSPVASTPTPAPVRVQPKPVVAAPSPDVPDAIDQCDPANETC